MLNTWDTKIHPFLQQTLESLLFARHSSRYQRHGDKQNSLSSWWQMNNSVNAWEINGDKLMVLTAMRRNKAAKRGGLNGGCSFRQWLERASLGRDHSEAREQAMHISRGRAFPGRGEMVPKSWGENSLAYSRRSKETNGAGMSKGGEWYRWN